MPASARFALTARSRCAKPSSFAPWLFRWACRCRRSTPPASRLPSAAEAAIGFELIEDLVRSAGADPKPDRKLVGQLVFLGSDVVVRQRDRCRQCEGPFRLGRLGSD